MAPGLRALGEALLPATELETGTKLHLSDLAAACRHAPCLLLRVAPLLRMCEEERGGEVHLGDAEVFGIGGALISLSSGLDPLPGTPPDLTA